MYIVHQCFFSANTSMTYIIWDKENNMCIGNLMSYFEH